MKILVSESQLNKLLNEIDLNNMDELIKYGDYLEVMKTSMQKKLSSFLELIRTSGLVNMREASQFLFMTKEHFDAMINYQKFQRKFDDNTIEILKEISEEIETVRNIIISSAMMYVENQGKKLTNQNLKYAIRKIITTTMVSWMQGILKKD
jgi:hypothetical protein